MRLAIVLCLVCAIPSEAVGQESSIPREQARLRFGLARDLSQADGGKLWRISLAGPMMFVDSRTREVVANQADALGHLKENHGVWVGTLSSEVQPANTSVEWNGVRWTMVLWDSLPRIGYEAGRLLMHESFHRIQPVLGLDSASPANAHLESESGRVWLRLEMRALAEALVQSPGSIVPGQTHETKRLAAIHDALRFRAVRHQLVGAAAAAEEAALEANEGLAEYTGLRLSGLPETAQEQRIAVELEARESSRTFTRSFAYGTGAALALLLDRYDPGWRETFAQKPDLAARLAQAIQFQPPAQTPDSNEVLEIAKSRYDGQWVFDEERKRQDDRDARLAALKNKFADKSVLIIETGKDFRFSFDPNLAESLDEQRVLYRSFSCSDEWGTVEAPEGALIQFSSPMSMRLPIPENATRETVPWKLTLKPGFKLETSPSGPWKIVRIPE